MTIANACSPYISTHIMCQSVWLYKLDVVPDQVFGGPVLAFYWACASPLHVYMVISRPTIPGTGPIKARLGL